MFTPGVYLYTTAIYRAIGIGGAITACACRQRANITITDSTFRWNTADHQCGAVHFLGIQSVNL